MINIYIIDDHSVVLEGLATMLGSEPDIEVVGKGTTTNQCLEFLSGNKPDILLTDISLEESSGIDLCRIATKEYPAVKVLAISTYHQGKIIHDMIENGASGYLLKNADKKEILTAIRAVAAGKTYLSFEADKAYRTYKASIENQPRLTKREKDVLVLITQGYTNNEISKMLFIAVDTVDTHRKNLYVKLNVSNTAQLIRYCIENKLLDS